MSKRKRYPPLQWETISGAHFVRMYDDQILSVAFSNLNKRQRLLYVYIKMMYKGEYTPHGKVSYTWGMAREHRLYTNKDYFYKDIHGLVDAGFLEIVDWNKTTRLPNVYRFSETWRKKGLLQIKNTNCNKSETQNE